MVEFEYALCKDKVEGVPVLVIKMGTIGVEEAKILINNIEKWLKKYHLLKVKILTKGFKDTEAARMFRERNYTIIDDAPMPLDYFLEYYGLKCEERGSKKKEVSSILYSLELILTNS